MEVAIKNPGKLLVKICLLIQFIFSKVTFVLGKKVI